MRRLLVLLCTIGVAGLAAGPAVAVPAELTPRPATLQATTIADVGAPGTLVPVEGRLLDAERRPLTGAEIVVTLAGSAQSPAGQSLTGSGGTFELFVPLPEQVPASGRVDLQVSFPGTAEAAASTLTLPVKVAPEQVVPAEVPAPTQATTPPTGASVQSSLPGQPSSGSAFLDQLIVAAAGLLAVMIGLFAIGAFLRRRRRT